MEMKFTSLTGVSVTQTLVPLQRIVPRERSAAVANDCLAIMPGSRLQVLHSVTFPMKSLVTPSDPTLPQLHVDLVRALDHRLSVPGGSSSSASSDLRLPRSSYHLFCVSLTTHSRSRLS